MTVQVLHFSKGGDLRQVLATVFLLVSLLIHLLDICASDSGFVHVSLLPFH